MDDLQARRLRVGAMIDQAEAELRDVDARIFTPGEDSEELKQRREILRRSIRKAYKAIEQYGGIRDV